MSKGEVSNGDQTELSTSKQSVKFKLQIGRVQMGQTTSRFTVI